MFPKDQQMSAERYELYYNKHDSFSLEHKEYLYVCLQQTYKILFKIVPKLLQNSVIKELTRCNNLLMSYIPDYSYKFFQEHILPDKQEIIEQLVANSDQFIRLMVKYVLLYNIQLAVNYFQLELVHEQVQDHYKKKMQNKLVSFLELLLNQLNGQVAKNWTKMDPYLEFWRDFTSSGEIFLEFMFRKEAIAIFIDFILGKKSPINIAEKKHSIGNNYMNPVFSSALSIICFISRHSLNFVDQYPKTFYIQKQYKYHKLSQNQKRCLRSLQFYEKICSYKQRNDYTMLLWIIYHFCCNNKEWSLEISKFLLSGLNSSTNNELSFPYISVLAFNQISSYFVTIDDEYLQLRFDWMLGIPQKTIDQNYNMILQKSIFEQTYTYIPGLQSPSLNNQSILNLLYFQLRSYVVCSSSFVIALYNLMNSMLILDRFFKLMMQLPPPSYIYASYVDWFKDYIQKFKREDQPVWQKEKMVKAFEETLHKLKDKIDLYWSNLNSEEKMEQDTTLKGVYMSNIIGRTLKIKKVGEIRFGQTHHYVHLTIKKIYTYYEKSLPTGTRNQFFPPCFFDIAGNINWQFLHKTPYYVFTKGLFQQESSRVVPLQYFNFGPTFWVIEGQCNCNFELIISLPLFSRNFNYEKHSKIKITIPYTGEQIEQFISVYMGVFQSEEEEKKEQQVGSSNVDINEFFITCKKCTYQNPITNSCCQLCYNNLFY